MDLIEEMLGLVSFIPKSNMIIAWEIRKPVYTWYIFYFTWFKWNLTLDPQR